MASHNDEYDSQLLPAYTPLKNTVNGKVCLYINIKYRIMYLKWFYFSKINVFLSASNAFQLLPRLTDLNQISYTSCWAWEKPITIIKNRKIENRKSEIRNRKIEKLKNRKNGKIENFQNLI